MLKFVHCVFGIANFEYIAAVFTNRKKGISGYWLNFLAFDFTWQQATYIKV